MKLIALFAAFSLIITTAHCLGGWKKNPTLDGNWAAFKKQHGKNYHPDDEDNRRKIWEDHDDVINKHNNETKHGLHTFEVGHNKYSDMNNTEFNSVMNRYRKRNSSSSTSGAYRVAVPLLADRALPNYVDWNVAGYVTPVKDQGQCGSCYAFAATGALEGQYFKKTGRLVSFSEQNIVDCDTLEAAQYKGSGGCNGGDEHTAQQYMVNNGGIDTEASYPYRGVQQGCTYNAANSGAKVTAANLVSPANSETALQNALATVGPVTVAIDASSNLFQLYKSGIYSGACASNNPDHAMLAVGYSAMSNGANFYIVKNSWGTSWGQAGYIWMQRNGGNVCGIAMENSYPSV